MKKLLLFCCGLFLALQLGAQNFYDTDVIRRIDITIPVADWATRLDSIKRHSDGDRLIGTVRVDGVTFDSVGIRFKGNSSYFNVQKYGGTKLPFNIKLDHIRRDQQLPGGIRTLKLSNVFRDPSFIREVLAYEVARNYMPAPRCNYASVTVNGQSVGLYNSSESVDEEFLATHFGGDGNDILFKCDPSWDQKKRPACKEGDKASLQYLGDGPPCYFPYYEIKSDTGWTELRNLTKRLNQKPEEVEALLDVPAVLWMHAFNNAIVNLDSYTGQLCHNYYLYRAPNGQFTPVVWDMNLAFGAFRFLDSWEPLSDEELQTLSPFVVYKNKNPLRPLITNLLSQERYRKLYAGYLLTIHEDFLASGKLLKRATVLQQKIRTAVSQDNNRLYPFEDFSKNLNETVEAGNVDIIGFSQLLTARTEYLSAHPVLNKELPGLADPVRSLSADELTLSIAPTGAESVTVFYRNSVEEFWRSKALAVDESGTYSVSVPRAEAGFYYLVIEGKRLSRVLPRNAPFGAFELK